MSIYTDTRVKALDGIVADLERRISALERDAVEIRADEINQRLHRSQLANSQQDDKKPKAKKWTRENSVL